MSTKDDKIAMRNLSHCIDGHTGIEDHAGFIASELAKESLRIREALAPFDPSAEWLPIESAPKGKKLILGYHNALGKWRTIMGTYYLPNTLYASDDDDDADEDGYAPEGWYEESESHAFILRTVHEPTHYMNRPAPPEERK